MGLETKVQSQTARPAALAGCGLSARYYPLTHTVYVWPGLSRVRVSRAFRSTFNFGGTVWSAPETAAAVEITLERGAHSIVEEISIPLARPRQLQLKNGRDLQLDKPGESVKVETDPNSEGLRTVLHVTPVGIEEWVSADEVGGDK